MKNGRPLKFKTVKDLQKRIDAYFKRCDEHTRPWVTKQGTVIQVPDPIPYTVTGLAEALDTTRQTLLEYQGEVAGREKKVPGFADAIRKAKLKCERFAEESLWQPKIATGVIFNLTNNYGWRNKQEVEDKKTYEVTGLEDMNDEQLDGLIKGLQNRVGKGTSGEAA